MSNRLPPIVGNWYSHRDKGEMFQVVALDEDSGTVEIQGFEGDLDELDFDEWVQLHVDAAEPPEDSSGALGYMEPDELGYTDLELAPDAAESLAPGPLTWEEILEDDDLDELPLH